MNYLLRTDRSKRSNSRAVFITVILFVIVVAAFRLIAPAAFSSVFEIVAAPFWKIETSVIEGDGLKTRSALLIENTQLRQELEAEKSKNIGIEIIRMENEQLKADWGRSNRGENILATVIRRPPYSPYDTLSIDIGADHLVQKNASVRSLSGSPIGKIIDVYPHSSRVLLFSTPGEKYDVLIGSTSVMATATGKGGGTFEVSLPRDTKIVEGEIVTIPSLFTEPFGIVGGVLSDPSRPFATILFKSPINIQELRWVTVDKITLIQ